jgi:hypothetical protein
MDIDGVDGMQDEEYEIPPLYFDITPHLWTFVKNVNQMSYDDIQETDEYQMITHAVEQEGVCFGFDIDSVRIQTDNINDLFENILRYLSTTIETIPHDSYVLYETYSLMHSAIAHSISVMSLYGQTEDLADMFKNINM